MAPSDLGTEHGFWLQDSDAYGTNPTLTDGSGISNGDTLDIAGGIVYIDLPDATGL